MEESQAREQHQFPGKRSKFPKRPKTVKQRMHQIIKIASITGAILLILCMVAPFLAVRILVNRHVTYRGVETAKYAMQGIYSTEEFGLQERIQYLTTSDGYSIWCSEIKAEQPKGIVICLTGIIQPSVTYFYGQAKLLQEAGYSSLLVEVRGHGSSSGDRICLGYEEVNDVAAVLSYVNDQPDYVNVPVIIQGVSMGGTIAINSFGQLQDIDALIAMSAYSSFEEEVVDLGHQYHIPSFLLNLEKPFLKLALKSIYGAKPVETMTPMQQLANANGRPALLICCSGDRDVPYTNSLRLHKEYPETQLWIKDSWEHFIVKGCDFRHVDEDTEYCDRILEFLQSVVEGKKL